MKKIHGSRTIAVHLEVTRMTKNIKQWKMLLNCHLHLESNVSITAEVTKSKKLKCYWLAITMIFKGGIENADVWKDTKS